MEAFFDSWASPLGELRLAAAEGALIGLWFADQRYFGQVPGLSVEKGAAPTAADTAVLTASKAWLEHYFRGQDPGPPPPCRLWGTAFQRRVWEALLRIPRGELRTYGELAAALGSAPRAVGRAVGRNPISIMVPCHRVLGAGGRLTGYAGGPDRKAALLRLEGYPEDSVLGGAGDPPPQTNRPRSPKPDIAPQ